MAPEVLETKGTSVGLWKGSLRLLGNRLAAAAVIVAFLIVLVAILAPWLAPASPTAVDLGGRLA
ncbi:MAG TPA: D,D-dipeptide ABC transporter permease, partial [Alicyclobacillus sp.]|nr:D,D-dipeptide ABC transporter permease [Alicyclobacillus sp.]